MTVTFNHLHFYSFLKHVRLIVRINISTLYCKHKLEHCPHLKWISFTTGSVIKFHFQLWLPLLYSSHLSLLTSFLHMPYNRKSVKITFSYQNHYICTYKNLFPLIRYSNSEWDKLWWPLNKFFFFNQSPFIITFQCKLSKHQQSITQYTAWTPSAKIFTY